MKDAAVSSETSVHSQTTRLHIPGAIPSIFLTLSTVNRLVFLTLMQCVYCTVVTEILSIYHLHQFQTSEVYVPYVEHPCTVIVDCCLYTVQLPISGFALSLCYSRTHLSLSLSLTRNQFRGKEGPHPRCCMDPDVGEGSNDFHLLRETETTL